MRARMMFGLTQVECEGDAKECFTELASAHELFSHNECKACGSKQVRPVVRDYEGNTYYEMKCDACRATLGFGQRRVDGALYPRRKGKDGEWLQNDGWVQFSRRDNSNGEAPF